MKILLLEDDYNRVEQFRKRLDELNERNTHMQEKIEMFHFEDAQSCIDNLEKGYTYNLMLLDHDLGGRVYVEFADPNTGSHVARWLNKNYNFSENKTSVITHTLNSPGAENIRGLVPNAVHIPFVWMKSLFHQIVKVN